MAATKRHRNRPTALLSAFPLCALVAASHWGCQSDSADVAGEDAPVPVIQNLESGDVHVRVTCEKTKAGVAEPIELELSADHPADLRVIWPPIEGDWGGFALSPQTSGTVQHEDGETATSSRRYALRALQSGEKTLPELALKFTDSRNSDADAIEITSRPIDFEITSALSGSEEPETVLEADATPVELPEKETLPWKPVVAGLVGVLVLGMLAYRLLRWLRDRKPPAMIVPAHRWALDELDRLAGSDLIARGDIHEYYFRLSAILRGYIARRFDILAPEMTTEEFVDFMRSDRTLSEQHRQSLGPFLESCDLVKFARHVPGQTETEAAFANARAFVIDTADYGPQKPPSSTSATQPAEAAA